MRWCQRRAVPTTLAMLYVNESDADTDVSFQTFGTPGPPTPPRNQGTPEVIPDNASSAPNIIMDGMCNACNSEVDMLQYSIQCFKCENYFHAVDCNDTSFCVSARTSFTQHLRPALDKTGSYENRFGKFFFMCDSCCTEIELKKALTQNKHVEIIDKKLDNFRKEFRNEISELKNVLLDSHKLSVPVTSTNDKFGNKSECKPINSWHDAARTKSLFSQKVLVVKNSESSGLSIDASTLRKTCVDSGIQVAKSFSTTKDEVGLVVNSDSDAKTLIENLKVAAPDHKVQDLPSKTPTITVVGVPNDITKENLMHEIFQQNPSIKKIHSEFSGQGEGKFMILSISKLNKNKEISKATIGVSNSIRDYLANVCNDCVYLGSGTCKVYDNFHIKRCFKCQKYGHISEKCVHSSTCG